MPRRISQAGLVHAMLCAAAMLVGCDEAPPPERKTASAAQGKAKAVPGLPRDMVAAVTAGKTATAVGVHFAMRSQARPAHSVEIDFAIVPHLTFTLLGAHFEAQPGLTIATGGELDEVANPPIDEPIPHKLVVVPNEEGVFLVSVIVQSEGDEGSVSRTFSVPVIVAPPAAPAPASPVSAENSSAE